LHRIRQQSDGAAALGAPERRRERTVAGEPPLLEQHLPVAFDAEELHSAEWGVRNAECVMTSAASVVRARPRPEGPDRTALGRREGWRTRERALRPHRP